MQVSATVSVNAAVEDVWRIIADIDNARTTISAIDELDVLERPNEGLVGLKWKETRTMFGKAATETMWITSAVENAYYEAEAQSHGSLYKSKMHVSGDGGTTALGMDFKAEPLTFGAKLTYLLMGFMIKGAMQKALQQDLEDIRAVAEGGAAQ